MKRCVLVVPTGPCRGAGVASPAIADFEQKFVGSTGISVLHWSVRCPGQSSGRVQMDITPPRWRDILLGGPLCPFRPADIPAAGLCGITICLAVGRLVSHFTAIILPSRTLDTRWMLKREDQWWGTRTRGQENHVGKVWTRGL
jgi:hypothetical protein